MLIIYSLPKIDIKYVIIAADLIKINVSLINRHFYVPSRA